MWVAKALLQKLDQGCVWSRRGSECSRTKLEMNAPPDFQFCFLCSHVATIHCLGPWKRQDWERQGPDYLTGKLIPLGRPWKSVGLCSVHSDSQDPNTKGENSVGRVTVSAQTRICFQSQWKAGSAFQISTPRVIKRVLLPSPHHCATCLQTRLLILRI